MRNWGVLRHQYHREAYSVAESIQRSQNRKHEFINRLSMGVLSIEDGSVDTDNLEEEGVSRLAKVLIYRQGATPPKLLESGRVPVDFQYEEERILSEFTTISGVSELSKYSKTY